jgi:hypothetical protein
MFIPDPDLDFTPTPDPGSRGSKRHRITGETIRMGMVDSFVGCDSCPAGLLPQLVQQLQAATRKFHQIDPGLTGNGTFRL